MRWYEIAAWTGGTVVLAAVVAHVYMWLLDRWVDRWEPAPEPPNYFRALRVEIMEAAGLPSETAVEADARISEELGPLPVSAETVQRAGEIVREVVAGHAEAPPD